MLMQQRRGAAPGGRKPTERGRPIPMHVQHVGTALIELTQQDRQRHRVEF